MVFKSNVDKHSKRIEEQSKYSKNYKNREPGVQYGYSSNEKCSRCGSKIHHETLRFSFILSSINYYIGMNNKKKFRLCPKCIKKIYEETKGEIPKQEEWDIIQISRSI